MCCGSPCGIFAEVCAASVRSGTRTHPDAARPIPLGRAPRLPHPLQGPGVGVGGHCLGATPVSLSVGGQSEST